jgi:hypothetical protein
MENKFITSHFLEACRNPQFHHCWMMAETWIELTTAHYNLPSEVQYTSKTLIEAIHRTKWLSSLDTTGEVNEHISLYLNKHKPKGDKQIYCFYAAPRGEKPLGKNATKEWLKEVSLATDLLNFKKTRNTA